MGSGDDSERIKVYVRLRPLSDKERQKDGQYPWRVEDNTLTQTSSKQKGSPRFNFDQIFAPEASNDVVYRDSANKIIQQVIAGFNGTIFAYGQTSSGKTYTMRGSKSQEGIIGRAVNHIFDLIDQTQNREFLLRVSYMEIYNEEINDLLVPEQTGLPVRESPESGVYVAGLREEIVDSPERILDLIEHGDRHKHIGSTQMNEKSSRSHTVFRMVIESRDIPSATNDPEQLPSAIYVSHLNLVDLAGSERVSKTGAEGQRLKEGSNINKSLLTLGKVIKALSEGAQAAGQHIPYRESKLTRILELSLGGNANTAIICNISPAGSNIDESLCSLRFATQAKNVKNHAVVNEVLSDAALLVRQQKEIEELRRQLAASGAGDVDEQVAEMRRKLLNAEKAAELLKEQLDTEKTRRMQAEQEASWSKIQLEQERKEKQSQAPSSRKRQNRRETWWGSRNQANLLEGVLSPQAAKQEAKRPKRGPVVPMASLLPIEEDEAAPGLDDVETPLHSVPSPPLARAPSEAGAEDGPAAAVSSEPGSFLPPVVLSPIPPTPCSPSLGVFQKMARRMQALREDVQEAAAVSQSPADHADGASAAEAASREQELQGRVQQLEAQLREKEAQLQQVCEADPHAQLALQLQMDLDASQQLRSALRSPPPAEPDAKRMCSPPEACSGPCTSKEVCENCVQLRAHLAEAQAEASQLRNAPPVVLHLQVGDSAASMVCDGTRLASPSMPGGLAADPSTPPAGGALHLSPPSQGTDVASLAHAVLDSAEQLRRELQQAVLQLADVCQQCPAPAEEEVDPDLEELADAIPTPPTPSFDTPLLQTVQLAMGINRSAAARIRDRIDAIRSAVSAGSWQDSLPPSATMARSPGGPAADTSGSSVPAVVRLLICVRGVEGGDGGGAPRPGAFGPAAASLPSPAAVTGPLTEAAPCAAVCSPAADLAVAASRLPQSTLPAAWQAAYLDAMLVDSAGGGNKQGDPDAAAQPQADEDGPEAPDFQSQLQAALLRVSQLEQQLAEAAHADTLVESTGAPVAGSQHLEEDIRAKVEEAVAELALEHEQVVQRLQAELALAASSSGQAAAPAVPGSKSSAKAAAVDRRKSDIHAIGEIQKARAEVKQKDQLLKVKERELAGLTKEIEKQRKKVEGLETKHRLAVQEKQNAGSLQNKCAKLESQVARLQERIKGSEDVQAGLRLERDDKLLQLAHTQGLLDRAQAEQDSLRTELGSESEARTQAETQLAAAAAELDARAAALQALEQQLEELQADMQAAQASRELAEAAAREEQSKLAAANAELTQEQQRLVAGSQEMEVALQAARTRVKELEEAAEAFHEQAELAAFQIRELTLHVDVLEGKKAEQEEQARQLQAAAETRKEQHQELQAAHEQLRQQLQTAESRLEEAGTEHRSLQTQLRSVQEQAEAERREAGAVEGRLQSQLAQVQEQVQAAAAAAHLREQELAAQLAGAQTQQAVADAALAEARQAAEQQQQQQREEMLQVLSAQERAAAAAEERGQQLERQVQDVEAAASQQVQAMQAEASQMQSELASRQDEAAELRRALEAAAAESQRFQAATATSQEEVASLQQERAGLTEQVQALQQRASQASERTAAADEQAQQQLQQAIEGRDVALRQLEQLQAQLQDAVAAQQAAARELEAMQTEWHTAAAEKQQLEEQLHSAQQELQAASAQAQEMAGSCNELQCDLDSVRAECLLLREKAAAGPMEEDLAAAGRQLESARLQHDHLREQVEQLEGEQLNLMQQNDVLSKQMEVLQEQLLREATHAQALLQERDQARASAAGRQEAVEDLQSRLQQAEQRAAQLVEEARGKENSPTAAAGAPPAMRSQAGSPKEAALPERGAEACAAPPRLDEAEIAQALSSIQEGLQSTLMQALQEKGNAMHEDAREARKKQAKLNAKHIRYVNMLRSMFGEPAVGQFVHYRQQLEADWDRWRKHSGRAPGVGELAIRKLIGQAQDTAQELQPLGGACAKVAGLQQQLAAFSSDLEAKLLEPLLHVKRQNMRLYAVSQKLFEWADSTFGPEVSEKVQQQREEEIRQRGQLRSIGNQLPPAT